MKTLAIGSFFVLFAIVTAVAAPAAYADHAKASVSIPEGTSVLGCEETNECYVPADVTVDLGGEVTWSNDDSAAHTVTSGTPPSNTDGKFDSGLFLAGATYSVTFSEEEGFEVGEYPYYCIVHTWMTGTVTVVGETDDHGDGMMTEDSMMDDDKMEGEGMMNDDKMMDDEMKMEDDDRTMAGDMMGNDDKGDMMMDDEHMMDDDKMMMMEDASATGMLSDGTEVKIWTSEPTSGEMMEFKIEFVGKEHVNHDVVITQNGEEVLNDAGAHHHEGMGMHMTAPLSSDDPVDITVTFTGYGVNDPKTGPIGEEVTFTNVVPEFGTIAAMILAVAIVSIIAVTARSKLSFMPRI